MGVGIVGEVQSNPTFEYSLTDGRMDGQTDKLKKHIQATLSLGSSISQSIS